LWIVLVTGAALVQTTWLRAIAVREAVPDLILVLVVYAAITEGEERAMFTGLLGGIFQDVSGGAVLGHHVLCLVLVGFVVGRLTTRLITEHPAVKIALVFSAAFLHGLLYTCIEYVQHPGSRPMHQILAGVIPGTFYTAVFSPVIFLGILLAEHPMRRRPKPASKGLPPR